MHQTESAVRDDRAPAQEIQALPGMHPNSGRQAEKLRNVKPTYLSNQCLQAAAQLTTPFQHSLKHRKLLPGVQTCPEFVLATGSTCQQTGSGDGATVAIFICWQSRDSCCWNPSPSKGTSSSSSSLVMKYNSQIKRHPDLSPKPQSLLLSKQQVEKSF